MAYNSGGDCLAEPICTTSEASRAVGCTSGDVSARGRSGSKSQRGNQGRSLLRVLGESTSLPRCPSGKDKRV